MLALGANARAARCDGFTAALAAAAAGHLDTVRALVGAGEDLGAAARELAALATDDAAADFLMPVMLRLAEAGANFGASGPDGRAPLDLAASPAMRAAIDKTLVAAGGLADRGSGPAGPDPLQDSDLGGEDGTDRSAAKLA